MKRHIRGASMDDVAQACKLFFILKKFKFCYFLNPIID